jgi:hypothetical protein
MHCYYHPDHDAVGICKNCCRGVCPECAADVAGSIACRRRCETEVQAIVDLIARNFTAYQKTATVYRRNAAFHAMAGLLFLGFGALTHTTISLFVLALGGLFMIMSYWSFAAARRYAKVEPVRPAA